MSHYFAIVLVPPDTEDIRATVAAIMDPHRETWNAREDYDGFWDWWRIGGRWDGVLVNADPLDESTHYSDAWETLERNVAPAHAIAERKFYRLVLPDGRTEAREVYNPNATDGNYFPENPRFVEMVGRDLVAHRDHLAVAVDYHC